MTTLRWGILGTGMIADAFAADLVHTDSGEIVAVGSRSQAGADRFGERHGIGHRHASYESLVADPDVDAIYVATPHPFHHDNALLALEAGKHVLVEKSFTMNAAQAVEVVAAARAHGLFLMEAMWTRHLPHVIEIRRLLAEGALGRVVTVMADHGQWFAFDSSSRLFAAQLGGGALLDLGVYPVSFASMVLGTPTRIQSLIEPAPTGVDGQVSILLGHDGGAQAVLNCTSSAVSPTRASIVGSDGRIDVDSPFYANVGFTFTPRQGKPSRFEAPERVHGLCYEAAEVARCVAAGLLESPAMPLDESVAIMRTMDAILAGAS
ncbi:MAG TPA: Gfo/Idh/MocA family oxidoreductase [Frankiaceae bacterium]|nr:Gfo/Idh/MocA family oxidoreductase [Frankiaceae bacterium]